MRYIDVDELNKKIFMGRDGKSWFGSVANDATVMRFNDDFFFEKQTDKLYLPENAVFCDINMTVILRYGDGTYGADIFTICGEFEPPMTLEDIRNKYPDAICITVIAEYPLCGDIWEYGNHGPKWEYKGTTRGFA